MLFSDAETSGGNTDLAPAGGFLGSPGGETWGAEGARFIEGSMEVYGGGGELSSPIISSQLLEEAPPGIF